MLYLFGFVLGCTLSAIDAVPHLLRRSAVASYDDSRHL